MPIFTYANGADKEETTESILKSIGRLFPTNDEEEEPPLPDIGQDLFNPDAQLDTSQVVDMRAVDQRYPPPVPPEAVALPPPPIAQFEGTEPPPPIASSEPFLPPLFPATEPPPLAPDDFLGRELEAQGYTRDATGSYIPPNPSITNEDFQEGIRRILAQHDAEQQAIRDQQLAEFERLTGIPFTAENLRLLQEEGVENSGLSAGELQRYGESMAAKQRENTLLESPGVDFSQYDLFKGQGGLAPELRDTDVNTFLEQGRQGHIDFGEGIPGEPRFSEAEPYGGPVNEYDIMIRALREGVDIDLAREIAQSHIAGHSGSISQGNLNDFGGINARASIGFNRYLQELDRQERLRQQLNEAPDWARDEFAVNQVFGQGGIEDFLQNTVTPAVGSAVSTLARPLDVIPGATFTGPDGTTLGQPYSQDIGELAENLVPQSDLDLLLAGLPAAAGTAAAVSRGVPLGRAALSNLAQQVLPLPGDLLQPELALGRGGMGAGGADDVLDNLGRVIPNPQQVGETARPTALTPEGTITPAAPSTQPVAPAPLGSGAPGGAGAPPQPPAPPVNLADEGYTSAPPPFPLPSSISTLEDITQSAQRASDRFTASTVGKVGQLPVIETAVNLANPAALTSAPPRVLIDELGEEGASQLQASLLAHTRKLDQANALSSAIEDGIRQQARAVGFKMDGARVVSVPGSPAIGDLFENPGKYQLTPAQRKFVNDVQAVLDDMNETEKLAGVKKGELFSEEGRYFPRQVISAGGTPNIRGGVRRPVGAKQGFQKGRFHEFMEQGMANGVDYAGDPAALVGTRIRAGLKAAADAELGTLTKPLGRTLTAANPMQIGEMGTMVPAIGGHAFPQETAKRLIDALGTRHAGSVENLATGINNIFRPLELMLDLGYFTLQGVATAINNPVAFAKALGYSLDALVTDGRFYGKYVMNNARQLDRFVPNGLLWRNTEFSFDQAAKGKALSNLFKKGPLGRFGAAFDNAMNVAGLENAKAMAGVSKELGPSKVRRALRGVVGNISGETDDAIAASIANKMGGRLSTANLGVSAGQRSLESNVVLAPAYYRAAFGLLGDAVQGGMRGGEARRTLAGLVGGAVATYYGVATALGQEPNLDPTSSKFLTVKIGGQHVGVGGPVYGIFRTMVEAAQNPQDVDNILSMKNPVTRWARGRLSPLVSLAVDLATQSTYTGKPIDSWQDVLTQAGGKALPFAGQTALDQGVEESIPSFFGLRAFPTSNKEQTTEGRDRLAKERGYDSYESIPDFNIRREIDNDPSVQPLIEKSQESFYKAYPAIGTVEHAADADREAAVSGGADWMTAFGLKPAAQLDAELASGTITGKEYRESIDALTDALWQRSVTRKENPAYVKEQAAIGGKKYEPGSPDEARNVYYEMTSNKGSYEEYEKALAEWQALYPQYTKQQIAPSAEPLSPGHAELKAARQQLQPYFDVRDQGWQMIQAADPALRQYPSFDDYYKKAVQEFSIGGTPLAEAEALADKFTATYQKFLSQQSEQFLTANEQNFALLKTLGKWGYYIPAKLRDYAGAR